MNPVLHLIQLYAQMDGLALDAGQLTHQFGPWLEGTGEAPANANSNCTEGLGTVLTVLQTLGYSCRVQSGTPQQALNAALPALMPVRDGRLMLVGRASVAAGDRLIVQLTET